MGVIYERAGEDQEAAGWYSKAASLGCCRAMNLLGLMQFAGRGHFERRRAMDNHSRSQGKDGEKKLAYLSFCAAARGGCANAYYNMGNCLENGNSVSKLYK